MSSLNIITQCNICGEKLSIPKEDSNYKGGWVHARCHGRGNISPAVLSAEIVRRIHKSPDGPDNLCQVVENLIREANL